MEYYLNSTHRDEGMARLIKVLAGDREKNKYFLIGYSCGLGLGGEETAQSFKINSMDINSFNDILKRFGPESQTPYYKRATWNKIKNASPGFAQQLEDLAEFFTNK